MTDINVTTLTGRLTKDCEQKSTQSGLSLSRFSIANNYYRKGAENNEDTNFFDCVILGKAAESLSVYLKKGVAVTVMGELRQQRWETNGQKNSKIELIVSNIKLGSSPQGSAPKSNVPEDMYEGSRQTNARDIEDDVEDIPF